MSGLSQRKDNLFWCHMRYRLNYIYRSLVFSYFTQRPFKYFFPPEAVSPWLYLVGNLRLRESCENIFIEEKLEKLLTCKQFNQYLEDEMEIVQKTYCTTSLLSSSYKQQKETVLLLQTGFFLSQGSADSLLLLLTRLWPKEGKEFPRKGVQVSGLLSWGNMIIISQHNEYQFLLLKGLNLYTQYKSVKQPIK